MKYCLDGIPIPKRGLDDYVLLLIDDTYRVINYLKVN
jgi:hypothetical protein